MLDFTEGQLLVLLVISEHFSALEGLELTRLAGGRLSGLSRNER